MFHRHDTQSDFDTLRDDVDRLRSDIGQLSGSVGHSFAKRARSARKGLMSDVHDGRAELGRWAGYAKDRSRHARHGAESEMSDHPFSTATVAFGLGFGVAVLVGALSRRSRRKQRGHRATEFGEDLT